MKTSTSLAAFAFAIAAHAPLFALEEAEFRKLHAQVRPANEEPWRQLPWRLSVLEARRDAEHARKPVYMLVRSGHPLGCV